MLQLEYLKPIIAKPKNQAHRILKDDGTSQYVLVSVFFRLFLNPFGSSNCTFH